MLSMVIKICIFCILLLIMTNSFGGRLLNKVKYTALGGKNGNFRGNI